MDQYTITYTQELTQVVNAHTLEGAAAFAKEYAGSNLLKVLSIYHTDLLSGVPALPSPTAA